VRGEFACYFLEGDEDGGRGNGEGSEGLHSFFGVGGSKPDVVGEEAEFIGSGGWWGGSAGTGVECDGIHCVGEGGEVRGFFRR